MEILYGTLEYLRKDKLGRGSDILGKGSLVTNAQRCLPIWPGCSWASSRTSSRVQSVSGGGAAGGVESRGQQGRRTSEHALPVG